MASSQLLRDDHQQILRKLREENRIIQGRSSSSASKKLVLSMSPNNNRIRKASAMSDERGKARKQEGGAGTNQMAGYETVENLARIKCESDEINDDQRNGEAGLTQQHLTTGRGKGNDCASAVPTSALSRLLQEPISTLPRENGSSVVACRAPAGTHRLRTHLGGPATNVDNNYSVNPMLKSQTPRKTKPRKRKTADEMCCTNDAMPKETTPCRDDSWLDTYKVKVSNGKSKGDDMQEDYKVNPCDFNKLLSSLDRRFIQEVNKQTSVTSQNAETRQLNGSDTQLNVPNTAHGLGKPATANCFQDVPLDSNALYLQGWCAMFHHIISVAAGQAASPTLWNHERNMVNNGGCDRTLREQLQLLDQRSCIGKEHTTMTPIMLAALTAATLKLMNQEKKPDNCCQLPYSSSAQTMNSISQWSNYLSECLQGSLMTTAEQCKNLVSQVVAASSSPSSPTAALPTVNQMLNALALQETNNDCMNKLDKRESRRSGYQQTAPGSSTSTKGLQSNTSVTFRSNPPCCLPGSTLSSHFPACTVQTTRSPPGGDLPQWSTSHYPTSSGKCCASTISSITQHLRQKKRQKQRLEGNCSGEVSGVNERNSDDIVDSSRIAQIEHQRYWTKGESKSRPAEEKRPYLSIDHNHQAEENRDVGDEAVDLSTHSAHRHALPTKQRFQCECTSARKRSKNYNDKEAVSNCQRYLPMTTKSRSMLVRCDELEDMDNMTSNRQLHNDGGIDTRLLPAKSVLQRYLEVTISEALEYVDCTLKLDDNDKMEILEACWHRLLIMHMLSEEYLHHTVDDELLSNIIHSSANADTSASDQGNNRPPSHAATAIKTNLNRLIAKGVKLNMDKALQVLASRLIVVNQAMRTRPQLKHLAMHESDLNSAIGALLGDRKNNVDSEEEKGQGNGFLHHAQCVLFINRLINMALPTGSEPPIGVPMVNGIENANCLQIVKAFRDELEVRINKSKEARSKQPTFSEWDS